MLEALRDSGWRNYSIFLHPDGFVVGYFEADDVDQALLRMAETEVNRRWQDASAHLFGSEIVWLSEVFNLEQQLLD
jgi:L-rhamnose mutarotase